MAQALRRKAWLGFGLAIVVLVALGSWLLVGSHLAQGSDTTTIQIGDGEGVPSTNVTVRLEALDIPGPGLGSYVIDVSYDSGVVEPVDCQEDPNGDIAMPSCNKDYAAGVVRCGGFQATAGLTGDVALCDITFHVIAEPEPCTDLLLTVDEFFNTDGVDILPRTLVDGKICAPPCPNDEDEDGVCDGVDDCLGTALEAIVDDIGCSAEQVDADGDGVCDPDAPSGGPPPECTGSDNCPYDDNPDQTDAPDGDGVGNVCDPDDDNDTVPDGDDTAPLDPYECQDEDEDTCDDCSQTGGPPDTANDGPDTDSDGICDAGDDDDDNDGLTNDEEIACGSDPLNADSTCEICDGIDNDLNEGIDEGFPDFDVDGIADCVDPDDDNDGFTDDQEDMCGSDPLDDTSTCEVCDGEDNDGDGAIDEGFPDTDGDGTADCVDTDDDNDGVGDDDDDCPATAEDDEVDTSGCSDDQVDPDADGICDPGAPSDGPAGCTGSDNCPDDDNPDQEDLDEDGEGDVCDDDDDGDMVPDDDDNCPLIDNPDQTDNDDDGLGDACDPDDDNDGVLDDDDNCPLVANPDQLDTDDDGVGDACQGDEDGDTVPNDDDNCPAVANADQADLDGDGLGDACDDDDDGDGASDAVENFYGSDPKDADSTPEALGYDQAYGATTCEDDVDNDGDGAMDENELDGPDPDDDADCGVAALPGVAMAGGWNDKCYIGDEMDVEDALSGIADKVLAIYILNQSQTFDHWFPSRSDINTIDTLQPYDQLFVLMSTAGTWSQTPSTETQPSVSLIEGWNSICYTGQTKAIEEATSEIADAIGILYKFFNATQNWARYVPDNADVSNLSTLTQLDSVFLLITQEGGITWVFDS